MSDTERDSERKREMSEIQRGIVRDTEIHSERDRNRKSYREIVRERER